MKTIARYLAALLAVVCYVAAAALGLFCCVTTERFALEVNGTGALQLIQQRHINYAAATLTETWQLSETVLAPWTEGAAVRQGAAVAAWWGALWQQEDANAAMPAWLSAQDEADLVAQVRADEGFISLTEEAQRRAIARDEVAYALDEAICDAVTPLRRSIIAMGIELVRGEIPLPLVRRAALIGACGLAAVALVLLIIARKAAGSALLATGLMMAALTLPVWLADVPDMLHQLNGIALQQGRNALACMALLWYGAAAVAAVMGLLIIGAKTAIRGEKA
ncbi:MAG: hypothetical protein IJE07_01585 [Clostridia bacterium]|nr:hypothetical protein [Clostridia bacterium]